VLYLVDTNVLLRFADRSHSLHMTVRAAVRKLRVAGNVLHAAPQNFIEFWNVATRPVARNGLGLSTPDADRLLRLVERLFPLLPESAAVYPQWRRLVVAHGVSGVKTHDTRLVAVMFVNGITRILTLNAADFVRYTAAGVTALDPHSV
jgi:predicted nucleic acid-binding protein